MKTGRAKEKLKFVFYNNNKKFYRLEYEERRRNEQDQASVGYLEKEILKQNLVLMSHKVYFDGSDILLTKTQMMAKIYLKSQAKMLS